MYRIESAFFQVANIQEESLGKIVDLFLKKKAISIFFFATFVLLILSEIKTHTDEKIFTLIIHSIPYIINL